MLNDGSVALVTGGASGLGKATAQALHARGARVVLLDLPHSDGSATAAALGARAAFVPADVTSSEDVESAVEYAASLGDLRVVVNCAGIVGPGKVLGRDRVLPLEDFEKVLRINLVGSFNVVRTSAVHIAKTNSEAGERGVIVNTASVAAFDGQIGQAAYAASKGGVAAMTLPLAREFARHQIRVMTIAPGIFETPMMAGLPRQAQDSLAQQVPHPSRLGKAGEFAALAMHIVDNPMLNGETVRLDGAIRMASK
ncbi:SDR family NAD(P)-dependent oxidoreductase [Pseudarthrobacter sp. AG30]|uniref:SDR family NAD(P)-dependent oxidoreductase n=1 Tax=Pseudarthrobacter sp. AG30 TaxID=2249742 RepID=UPI000D6E1CDB|nr:SDR family NAD(P)-dependent oxidoreductase [Pseudarthrobacter sp. AG30]RAX15133.1 SDR family NAD(P)-dependent oxidoreductase [Pseudarthrobacter sp. AG30]